jgi:hypothetical protein
MRFLILAQVARAKGKDLSHSSTSPALIAESQGCQLLNQFAQLARQNQCPEHRVFVFSNIAFAGDFTHPGV